MNKPIFYSGTKNASSWAMRAWLALRAAGYDFEERVVDIRCPQRFDNLARISRFSPQASVPALDTGRTIIFDSNAIMEFANDVSGGKLLPSDHEQRAHARSLIAWQHAGLPRICERISFESGFYPLKRRLTQEEILQCHRVFDCYEECLTMSKGPFLFGDVSLADFMHVPFAFKMHRHRANLTNHPHTSQWIEAILAYDHVAEWLTEADQLPHIWFDEYLLPDTAPAVQLECA